MAQVLFATDTTPSLVDLDANSSELFALKQLVTTPVHSGYSAYAAANVKVTFVADGLQTIISAPGTTAATSLIVPFADQTIYSLLGRSTFGPGIQARWDSATVNRYLAIGTYNGVGTWAEYFRLQEGDFFGTSTGKIGYGTGAGGTVTQATSKSTTVTLNKPTGRITLNAAALGSGALVSFTVNNSLVSAADTVIVNLVGGTYSAVQNYRVWVENMAAGLFAITLENRSGGSLSEAVGINFTVIKGATT